MFRNSEAIQTEQTRPQLHLLLCGNPSDETGTVFGSVEACLMFGLLALGFWFSVLGFGTGSLDDQ